MAKTKVMPLPTWMNRPALVWDPTLVAGTNTVNETSSSESNSSPVVPSTCVYWQSREWHSEDSSHNSTMACVTYRDLFATAAVTVVRLRKVLEQLPTTSVDPVSSTRGIPVVVAIPEGPWLPLAVLVVHALNRSFGGDGVTNSTGSSNGSPGCFAMLVPLEPSEAMERNRRILLDIQPRLVLCVSDGKNRISKDMDRLNELVESSISKERTIPSCEVMDFATFVAEALVLQKPSPTFVEDFFSFKSLSEDEAGPADNWSLQDWVAGAADFLVDEESRVSLSKERRISHIVYTSGTTGQPKGCVSSIQSLQHYLQVKNEVHSIQPESTVLLASALSFDPCLSDILATFHAKSQLALAPRSRLLNSLATILRRLQVTHVLCTPTLWGMIDVESEVSSPAGATDDPQNRPRASLLFPALQVVALGGEPIPKLVRQRWARAHIHEQGCRLLATYGVTEACVYQTVGEIMLLINNDKSIGQNVGKPFRGLDIRICKENNQEALQDVQAGETGEVILSGAQMDALTSYWKRPELGYKFVVEQSAGNDGQTIRYHYRTGDRGTLDPSDGTLRILGRIGGEEGMVKVNGVRIELGEIEAALVDDMISTVPVVVESCMVQILQGKDDSSTRSEVHAYCVLSEQALSELGLPGKTEMPKSGVLVTGGVLLPLLRARCANSLKAACIPNAFVLLPNLPLSPTGKRDCRSLPLLSECASLYQDEDQGTLLRDHGHLGKFLADIICECLNLQTLQREMLTTKATLDGLGGDSLAATRVIRALYAYHHQVENTRYLGGDFGKFEGPFDVVHILRAKSLGDYVNMLERNNVGLHAEAAHEDKKESAEIPSPSAPDTETSDPRSKEKPRNALYDSLLLATTRGQSSIAIALLHAGADPNYGNHDNRLGKVSGGFFHHKFVFHSSPLHLACKQGDDRMVYHLLSKGAKCKSPDAAGLFPLHLVASSMDGLESSPEEDARRLECVKHLLDAGTPIVMRDGNHQTVLHAAARSGHSSILRYVMTLWNESGMQRPQARSNQLFVNWMDRWYRTPVHWAILNGRTEALRVALEMGSTPTPFKPRAGKRTSVAIEYPFEICERLYPPDDATSSSSIDPGKREKGATMRLLLQEAIAREMAQTKS
jgi:acyl-coenzyme A synthetase/AMP-(fatty) acid ligase/ankyrin repeat protein